MVKHVHIILEDKEYTRVDKIKGKRTWKKALLDALENEERK